MYNLYPYIHQDLQQTYVCELVAGQVLDKDSCSPFINTNTYRHKVHCAGPRLAAEKVAYSVCGLSISELASAAVHPRREEIPVYWDTSVNMSTFFPLDDK